MQLYHRHHAKVVTFGGSGGIGSAGFDSCIGRSEKIKGVVSDSINIFFMA